MLDKKKWMRRFEKYLRAGVVTVVGGVIVDVASKQAFTVRPRALGRRLSLVLSKTIFKYLPGSPTPKESIIFVSAFVPPTEKI